MFIGRIASYASYHDRLALLQPWRVELVVFNGSLRRRLARRAKQASLRQDAISLCTPSSRMSPSVIGGPAGCLDFEAINFRPRSWGLVKFAWKYPSIFKILARGLGLLGSLIFLNYFFEVFNG